MFSSSIELEQKKKYLKKTLKTEHKLTEKILQVMKEKW